ncbi:MAG: L-fuconate dehydratase, partial [uncultured Rubrobacteraceae bacterium]
EPDHHNRGRSPRRPVPHLGEPRRLGRHEPRPRLLGRLRRPQNGLPGWPRRPRPHLHHRARQRVVRRRHRRPRPPHRRQDARVVRRGHGHLLAQRCRRQPTPLGRPREGRHPPGDRGGRERRLGPLRQERGEATLEAPLGHEPRGAGPLRPVPLHNRRHHPRRGAEDAARKRGDESRARGGDAGGGLPGLHDERGLARLPGREDPASLPRSGRGRMGARQDQGRSRPRGRRAPRPDRTRGDRPEPQAHAGREPGLGRGRGHRQYGAPRRVRPVVDRGANEPRRRARPRSRGPRRLPRRRGDRRARPEPRPLQATLPGRRHKLLPGRRLPPRRRQRGPRRAPDGEEIRGAGLPARGWRRPVRVRAAPLDLRLHLRQRLPGRPRPGVRGPPARAFLGPGKDRERALRATREAGLQHRDARGITGDLRVPSGQRLGREVGGRHTPAPRRPAGERV